MKNYIKVFYTSQNTISITLENQVNEFLAEIHTKGHRVMGMKLNDKLLILTLTDEKRKN